ncbi:hypothetical protein CYLTODRAFT_424532 [Cylindrobasidium torrendii FP15055 ss-10]|uniref:Uncharacterized protein n=1 Tax=Cylindrobasidium torrendii FP15055 ss-10 TaxID=1314674 RepID=A0A0D7B3T1_9AGAR|nr:hypothetical protein CYLTODRAFT_424532 [Cylindrobasidium torrendii FP15055 ss-10]
MKSEVDQCRNNSECLCPNREIPQHMPFPKDTFAKDPKFNHLVHSNDYPTRPEEQILQASVADLQSRKAALQSSSQRLHALRNSYHNQIDRINAELKSQKRTTLLVEDAIRVRKRLLSPVRRLPTEILRHIFLSTVEHIPLRIAELDEAESWSFKDPPSMLWTIELVCQQWRIAIVNYPRLWSYVSIRIPPHDTGVSIPLHLPRLAVQLDRAQLHTLSIALYPGLALNRISTSVPDYLIHLLFPYARRIKSLDLILPYKHIHSLSFLVKRMSSLTHLTISTPSAPEISDADLSSGEPAPLFQHCAQLQTVSFVDVHAPISRFALPWHTIISLSTACSYHPRRRSLALGILPREIYLILKESLELRQCSFNVRMGSGPTDIHGFTVLTAPRLQHLELVFPVQQGGALLQLLEKISLPSLVSLSISTKAIYPVTWASHYIFASVVDTIERWKCPLQRIEYLRGDVGGDDLARLVRETKTTLSALELNEVVMSKTAVVLDINHHCSEADILLESILEHLSIVSLTTLRMRGDELSKDWANGDVFAALVNAVERSQCPLEELEYQRGFTEYEDVIRLVGATNNTLKSLSLIRITSYNMAIYLVDALSVSRSPNGPLLAPHLHTLVLTGCVHRSTEARTFSARAYVEMVRSRYAEAPFRKLHIGWEPESDECPLSDAVRELGLIQTELRNLAPEVLFTHGIIEEDEDEQKDSEEEGED